MVHNSSRLSQRSDRLEKRDRHQPRVVSRARQVHPGQLRQFEDCANVLFGFDTADYVIANCTRRKLSLPLIHMPENIDDIGTTVIFQCSLVSICVLPEVKRRQMKTEATDFAKQRIKEDLRQIFSMIFRETAVDERKVTFEIRGATVSALFHLARLLKSNDYIRKKSAIQLGGRNPP